jgi:hypothetical protein
VGRGVGIDRLHGPYQLSTIGVFDLHGPYRLLVNNRCLRPNALRGLLTPGGVRLVTAHTGCAVLNWCAAARLQRTKNCKNVWPTPPCTVGRWSPPRATATCAARQPSPRRPCAWPSGARGWPLMMVSKSRSLLCDGALWRSPFAAFSIFGFAHDHCRQAHTGHAGSPLRLTGQKHLRREK